MPYSTLGIIEETYRGWTIRLVHRAGYGYVWAAWKNRQMLKSTRDFLTSYDQARHYAHQEIDKCESADTSDDAVG